MAFATTTVTGTYVQADGVTPSVGTVSFLLRSPFGDSDNDQIIAPGNLMATLDGAGAFTLSVPNSDVVGQTWLVVEVVDGVRRTYNVEVPAAGPVDLADLAPVEPTDLSGSYVLASTLSLSNLDDVDLTGVADTQVLAYNSATGKFEPTDNLGGGGGTDDQTAAEVPFTPTGGLASLNVQDALAEVDSEKAASGHNHDASYSDVAHNHDADYSATGHTHDGRYYTETETDNALAGKADSAHNHDGSYSALGHNHDADYQPLDAVLTATTASFTTADEAKLDSLPSSPRRIYETAQGTWTDDAPSGRSDYVDTIEFVGVSDPTDGTNGITTPANMVAGDRWTPVADYV